MSTDKTVKMLVIALPAAGQGRKKARRSMQKFYLDMTEEEFNSTLKRLFGNDSDDGKLAINQSQIMLRRDGPWAAIGTQERVLMIGFNTCFSREVGWQQTVANLLRELERGKT